MEYTGKMYSLSDSKGNVFYIGCTTSALEVRLRSHITEAFSCTKNVSRDRSPKHKIIIESDYQITATILEIITVSADSPRQANLKLRETESAWINKYIELGYVLANKEYRSIKKLDLPVEERVGLSISVSNRKLVVNEGAV